MALKKLKEAAIAEIPSMPIVIPTPIAKLSVDYASEGLNNMASKINEIIDRLCQPS